MGVKVETPALQPLTLWSRRIIPHILRSELPLALLHQLLGRDLYHLQWLTLTHRMTIAMLQQELIDGITPGLNLIPADTGNDVILVSHALL